MSILDLLHHLLDLRRLCYIAINHQRILQFSGDICRVGFVLTLRVREIIDHAGRAAIVESFDHLRADAARAAGNQRNFASEIEGILHLVI